MGVTVNNESSFRGCRPLILANIQKKRRKKGRVHLASSLEDMAAARAAPGWEGEPLGGASGIIQPNGLRNWKAASGWTISFA